MAKTKKAPALDQNGIEILGFLDEGRPLSAPAAPESAGVLRKVGDIGVAAGQGVVSGVKMLSDLAGAGNPVSEALDSAGKGLDTLYSPARLAERAARAQTIKEAEASGSTWEEIKAHAGGFFEAPVQSVANAAGSMVPTVASAFIPGALPARIAAGTMGLAQGVGTIKGSVYDAVERKWLEAGAPPEIAKQKADEAQAYGGENTPAMIAGGALGLVAGGSGVEHYITSGAARAGLGGAGVLARGARGALAEALPEGAQGGQERQASNVALQNQGFDVPTWQGVAGSAVAEALPSAPLGGGMAAFRPAPLPTVDPSIVPPGTVPPVSPATQPAMQPAPMDVAGQVAARRSAAQLAVRDALDAGVYGADAGPIPPAPPAGPMQGPAQVQAITPAGPLARAAETAAGAQAGQNAAAIAAGVDPAQRLAELEQKATGTKDQKVAGPDGKPVVIPGTPAQFLTDAEKAERDSLKGSASEAEIAARSPATPSSPAAMAAADPLPAMHQEAADNLAAQKQFGGDRPGIPSTNAVVYQEPKPRAMPPAFEQPVTPGQIFESIDEVRARQRQDGEMLSSLVKKNEVVPFRGKPPAIDDKTIDGEGLYRVIGETTAETPDFADHTDLAGRAFAKNPRLTLEVLRDPNIDHQAEAIVLKAITRGGNATAQYAKLALEAFQARPQAGGAQQETGRPAGGMPEGQEVSAAQPEPLARQEGQTGRPQGAPSGFVATPDGKRVRISQHQRGSSVLDPQADVGAFTYEVSAGSTDNNPLLMVLGKDGRLTPAKNAIGPDNKSNGTAWVPPNQEAADRVRALLEARSQMPVGSPERKANDADIKRAVLGEPAKVESDSTPPLTIEPVSDTTMVIRGPGKHKDAIKAAGGSWNTPQKGWTFPKAREAQVRAALGDLVGATPAPAEVKRGTVGMKLGADEVVLTNTGRKTRPFPKVATDTDRKARNTAKAIDSWLITNALEEASSRGDEFNRRQFQNANPLNLTTADKDSAEEYLFGDYIPPVIPSILKPLVPAKPAGDAPAAAPRSATGPLTVTENADLGQFTVRDDQGSSMGSFTVKDGKATAIKARAQWAMDDVKAAADKHAAQLKPAPVAAPKAEPAPTKNTIFTDEAYAAAKERMKARMSRLNSGVDPEMLFDGIVMAGHHIERGARTFAAYSKAMIAELGEGIRPYLKSFYMGIKYDPRAAAFAGEMDNEADIDKAGVDAQSAPAQNENPNGDTDVQPDRGAKDQGASQGDQGQGNPDKQGSAPADSEGVADSAPENVGGTPAAGTRKRSGAGVAGGDVGGQRPVRKSRDAADGRDGAGRTGVPDDGTGDGGRVTPPGQRANYHITDPEALIGGGPKARFEHNKKAIEAYQSITSEGREPTKEDLDAMAGYIGWGSFGQELFQGSFSAPAEKPGWTKEGAWLREHLGEAGWKSAQASIINAHYTDPITVGAMWDMVRQLGFTGGRVLEPSMGVGNFFGLMPRDLMAQSSLTGIEMEKTTGGMARTLYPEANIQIKPYQDSRTADGFYDLVIGNWPFAKDGPADRRYMNLSPSLHDFFFLKALDQTRPGGLVVGITSAGTMDKKSTLTRAALAGKADLVAAFRLPSGAFEQYAGTSVVTDIIILKRRDTPGDARASGFLTTVEVPTKSGEPISVNEYFVKNPGNVLGTLNWGHGSTYGRPSMIVERPADLERRLKAIAPTLPAVYTPRTTAGKTIQYVTNNTTDRQQSVTLKDGKLYQVQGERLAPLVDVTDYRVKDGAKTAAREAQLSALIEMRRAYGSLIDAEREGAADMEAKRTALREIYDAFVDAHGTIADSDGLAILKRVRDPFYPSLAALERADGRPAAIMARSTTRAKRRMDNPSVRDAMVLARNEAIDLNMERIAEIAKVTPEAAAKELIEAGAVFRTPVGTYEPSDVYLSGNVRRKIREAQSAADQGEDMARNIEALSKVVPKDIPYFNIEAKFGATWIRPEQYRDFVASLLGIAPNDNMVVRWTVNRWRVLFTDRALNARPEATTTWGHSSVRFDKLLTSAMGNVAIKVTYRDSDGNLQTDEKASAEANDKAMKIREQFATWLWSDPVRRIEMEQTFNEVMNAIALPKYDGSFLNFDGMALRRGDSPFNLRKHQIDAIWRGLANGRSINAHEVGTGKTYTMGGLVVESRRYGLAKKPIIFAHNANSASVAREIGEMYPGAKLLYIDNLAPERIATTLRQIANDDWDAIIVPHSLVDRFSLKRETLEEMQREQIDALEQEAIEAAKEDGASLSVGDMDDETAMKKVRSVTAKQLVHARNAIIKKIDEMALRSSREDAISFEDMGIDMVVVDEAHEFKKPPITTRMQMKGLNTQSSAQSISMQFLTDYVKKLNGGRGVHTFTGTPITNTMNEIYNQMRFVMDDQMARDGVRDWDAWFNTFADSTSDVELTAAGEYEPVTRLASFVNVAELRRMIGQYMDIVFADDMPEFKPRATKSGKTLSDKNLTDAERDQLLNGRSEDPVGRPYKKVVTDIAEMTGAQAKIMAELQRLSTMFKNASKKDRRDLMLAGHPSSPVIVETNAANAGLDARLYDMNAADDPNAKVNRAATNIMKHYNEHPKATQVVFVERGFSDASVSRKKDRSTGTVVTTKKARFNLVRELVDKLVAAGIPEHQIAIVDGSTNKEKRKATADAMNRAEIRVVIGNTKTLGVGVNMQTNLRAMHHLDAPWMPGELEQRNGRGHRQGNAWNTVLEYRYLTERIDGRRWQVLAVKDRFIKAFLRADDSVRVIDGDAVSMDEEGDIGATLADAAGDPRLMLMNKIKGDVTKLETKERMHSQGVFDAVRMVKELKRSIEDDTATVAKLESDSTKFRAAVKGDLSVKIGGKTFTDIESANAALLAQVSSLEPGGGGREIGQAWDFTITASLPYRGADVRYAISDQMSYAMGKPTVESARQTLYGISNRIADVKARMSASADSIPRMEEASKAPFAREKDLEKKRQMFADLESDIQANPVPAPSWLRSGAPTNTEVYIDGKPAVVEGHRWTNEGFLLTVSQGDSTRDVDYTEAKDVNGLPVYEAREFAPPKVNPSQAAQGGVQQAVQSGAKFSRGTGRAGARVQETVDRIKKGWQNAPEIVVIDSMAQAPADVQANDAAQRSGGATGDPEGFWYAGKVYLVSSALETDADVERVLAHEVLGHAGLRGAFGVKALGDILEQLAAARPAAIRAKMAEYGLKNSPAMRMVAAEEVLAELAQTQPELGFVRRAIAAIRTWLRAHGFDSQISRDELIRNYILPARRYVEGKGANASPAAMVPAFLRGQQSAEFKAWFGDSKVVDAQGKPLVVYHGTRSDISAFSDAGRENKGFYFSPDRGLANQYTRDLKDVVDGTPNRSSDGGNVLPVYLSLKNPKVIDAVDRQTLLQRLRDPKQRERAAEERLSSAVLTRAKIAELEAQGYDGIMNHSAKEFIAFRPEQIKSAVGNRGTFDQTNPDIRFSRRAATTMARETFADMMQSSKSFNWWNKSIGTQYQKAQQNPTFGKVYNRVQDYIQDISDFGSRAAAQAPTLLPRLDKIRDVLKKPVSAADQKAIAKALYAGTLAGESVIEGKLWTDAELREQFSLTDPQISLYREARAAIDQSIDDLGRTEIAKLVGDTVDPMFAQQAREASSMEDAAEVLQAGLDEKIAEARQDESEDGQRKVAHLRSLRRSVRAQTKRLEQLKDAGYMPLMRFGKYAVNVADPDVEGESLHFALFDSERLANAHARELRNDPQFAGKQITQGIISDRAAQLMQGVDPATLEIFAEAIGASESEVFQEYLKLVTSQRSAMKRLIERKGTPGYSEDIKRTLASFITSNARAASGNMHLRDLLLNTSKIKEGDVKDEAIGLVKHVLDPQPDPSAKARSLLFMQFIGGSVASALVNLTQPVTMTLPYLSQYSSPAKAANLLRKATLSAIRGVTGDEAAALKRAESDGIVSPQEIHFLYGEAEKAFGSNPLLQRAGFLWGAPFGLAEQFNRRATFIAAYRLGVERGEANPFAFAEKAVIETQGVYNRGNASNWARNPVGGALLTFKQFSVAYIELLKRLPNRERAIALAILALASGMEGLPGADDLDDILDTVSQALGYDWSAKASKRDFITATLGPEMAQFATRGVSAFLPIDISARMGLGNLLPGTGLMMQSRQDKGREVSEVFGAPGGAVQMVGKAATKALAGEPFGAATAIMPVALQNILDPHRGALALAASGQYKDEGGRRVIDVDAVDALMKAAGFNPASVAETQMSARIAKQSIDLARAVESGIVADMAAGRVDKDADRTAAARERLAEWNAKNPDSPIRIQESQIRRRAHEMQTTKTDRLARTAPREMRAVVRRRLEPVDE